MPLSDGSAGELKLDKVDPAKIEKQIKQISKAMFKAAADLEFEKAAISADSLSTKELALWQQIQKSQNRMS